MRNATPLAVALALASCATVGQEPEPLTDQDVRRGIALHIGEAELDDDDWSPIEDQDAVAIVFDWYKPEDPLGYEVGLLMSEDDADVRVGSLGVFEVDGELFEVSGGVRKTWEFEGTPARVYVGGGAAYVTAELDISQGAASADDDDSTFAGYAHIGAYAQVAQGFRVGIDYRKLFGADIDLFDLDGDADYDLLSFFVGWAF